MKTAEVYIPIDRRLALANGEELPERVSGSVLFADISGFTPMTEALVRQLGPRRGAEELTNQLNAVYDALIAEVHRYRGSVIGFAGDAITCWLDGDNGIRATACGLAMQQAMQQFASVTIPTGETMSLAMKAAVSTGPVRRFLVGNPTIQSIDVLAGATLERMATAEQLANKGEVILDPVTMQNIGYCASMKETRTDDNTGSTFAVVDSLSYMPHVEPWPGLPGTTSTPATVQGDAESGFGLSEEHVRPWLCRPIYQRVTDGMGQFLAEIRPAVPLFLRFTGIDYDYDQDACRKLNTFIQWVQSILERYEGFLIQLTVGDKGSYLYAAFGAPLAHDDDPIRAVATALELQSHPFDFISSVQIGITRGQMRTGAYGSTTRRTYGVLGDEVNLAARLMAKTDPGQIMVSQRIVDAASHSYAFKSLGVIQVKGKHEPIEVSLATGRKTAARSISSPVIDPLVGRDAELDHMRQVVDSVLAGQGHILRVEGSAGIGKSHLAAVFSMQATNRGVRAFLGSCQSVTQRIAYAPWVPIFRAFFALDAEPQEPESSDSSDDITAKHIAQVEAIFTQMNPNWSTRFPLLAELLDLPIPDNATTAAFEPRLRQEATLALAVDLLHAWSSINPLLLLIEDAHWIDESSNKLVTALSRSLANHPILLMLVHRPPLREAHEAKDPTPLFPDINMLPHHHYMNLGDLSPKAVRGLVSNRLKGHPSELALSLIQLHTQGNPFFIQELVDALREANNLYQLPDGTWSLSDTLINTLRNANCLIKDEKTGVWKLDPRAQLSSIEMGIPESVQGVVLSRIDRLPETHKLSLKVASVIGRVFVLNVLQQSHPAQVDVDELLNEFQVMETREFTYLEVPPPQTMYMFKHHITQEVAYSTLLETQRQELHLGVAQTIERILPDAVEQLAYHYSRSKDRQKTIEYIDKAAQKAQREFANETALHYYQQALTMEERWSWYKGQIEILHVLGRREEQKALLQKTESLPDASAFDIAYLWAQYHEATGQYPEALAAIQRALAINPDSTACHLLGASCAYLQGNLDDAAQWVQQGLAIAERQAHVPDQAQAYKWLGIVLADQGKLSEGIAAQERSVKLLEQMEHMAGLSTAYNSLGILYQDAGRWQESINCYMRSLQLCETIGDVAGMGRAALNLGLILIDQGNLDRADELCIYAIEKFERIGHNLYLGLVIANRGELMLKKGIPSEALRILLESIDILEGIQARIDQPEILCNAAEAALALDDIAQATDLANRSLQMAQELKLALREAIAQRMLAQIALRQQDLAAANTYLEHSSTALEQLGHQLQLGKTLYWKAKLAQASQKPDQATQWGRQAEQIFHDIDARYDLQLVGTLMDEVGVR